MAKALLISTLKKARTNKRYKDKQAASRRAYSYSYKFRFPMKLILVPIMLCLSSLLMAFAWLGHLKFLNRGFFPALIISWIIVLPEYILNVSAIRYGHGVYTGGEMAAFNLGTGVLSVALVSRFFLKERLNYYQIFGFFLMAWAIILVVYD